MFLYSYNFQNRVKKGDQGLKKSIISKFIIANLGKLYIFKQSIAYFLSSKYEIQDPDLLRFINSLIHLLTVSCSAGDEEPTVPNPRRGMPAKSITTLIPDL